MNKEDIRLIQFNQQTLDEAYLNCCHNGDLESIKYMLTSTDVLLRPDLTYIDDIHGYEGLTHAAINGHLDLVEYLLFSPELKINDSFSPHRINYLKLICQNGHLHVADFLLEKKIFNPETVFMRIISHEKASELCKYLIFNCDIPITSEVDKVINGIPFIKELFEKRELNKELNKELNICKKINKKVKL